jgi:tetratricopeptide (TPR) repeat protein
MMRSLRHAAALAALLAFRSVPVHAESPQSEVAAADRSFTDGDWAAAAAAYDSLARAHPQDAQFHLRLGVALHGLGRFREAVPALEAAERLGSPGPNASYRLAKAYARAGRIDDAGRALLRAAERGFFALPTVESDPDLAGVRAGAGYAEVRQAIDRNARPCVYEPEYRALDFWVGEWDVRPTGASDTTPASSSRIELVEDQCVVSEHYSTAAGYSGRSFNSYDPEKKRWQQFWVDNKGATHHYVGQARDGNLYYEADGIHVPGTPGPVRMKMTFFNEGPNLVRQLGEQSSDGGQTWTTAYDLSYRRRNAAAGS